MNRFHVYRSTVQPLSLSRFSRTGSASNAASVTWPLPSSSMAIQAAGYAASML
jgi:hypothetical protein